VDYTKIAVAGKIIDKKLTGLEKWDLLVFESEFGTYRLEKWWQAV
jgi:hypothetical protein